MDDVWNLKTLEVHEIFHDQIDTLVSEVLVLQNMGAVEETLEVVRKRYITQARELKLPILFLFNLTDQTIGGLHYSGMIACADKKGVRWFEPSRGGIRERNLPMAKRVLQFLENNSSELNVGAVDTRPGEWKNHCPSQADGSEHDSMRCGHTLRAAMLSHLRKDMGAGGGGGDGGGGSGGGQQAGQQTVGASGVAEASGSSAPAMTFVAQHTLSGRKEPMRTPPGAAAAQAGAMNSSAGPVRAHPAATCLAKCETASFETRHANLVAQLSLPCKHRLCGCSRGCTSHSFLSV